MVWKEKWVCGLWGSQALFSQWRCCCQVAPAGVSVYAGKKVVESEKGQGTEVLVGIALS